MAFTKVRAIGFMVKNLEEALDHYCKAFGLPKVPIQDFPTAGVKGARVPVGDIIFDLMEPTDPEGAVARALNRRGEGVYLITVGLDDMDASLKHMEAMGLTIVEASPPGSTRRHPFVHPKSAHGVLFELSNPDS